MCQRVGGVVLRLSNIRDCERQSRHSGEREYEVAEVQPPEYAGNPWGDDGFTFLNVLDASPICWHVRRLDGNALFTPHRHRRSSFAWRSGGSGDVYGCPRKASPAAAPNRAVRIYPPLGRHRATFDRFERRRMDARWRPERSHFLFLSRSVDRAAIWVRRSLSRPLSHSTSRSATAQRHHDARCDAGGLSRTGFPESVVAANTASLLVVHRAFIVAPSRPNSGREPL